MTINLFKQFLIIILILFFVAIFWWSGIPILYLVDFPTAAALIIGTGLLYSIRYSRGMDIVKKREILLSSLKLVSFVTLFIGIIGVLTRMTDPQMVFWGFAVALITVPYTGALWGLIELYFNFRASREIDVYSDSKPQEDMSSSSVLDPIEMERVLFKQKFALTPRETEIVGELLKGKTNREIAEALFISEMTVKKHMANIFAKVGVSNRQALIVLLHHRSEELHLGDKR